MTDLETRLRQAGNDLHLDRPVADVITRGKAMRRRRRATQVALAGSAMIAAVVVPVLASRMTDGTNPNAPVSAPPPVRLSPSALEAADKYCRANLPMSILDHTAEVFGADRSGGDTVVLYRTPGTGTAYGVCDVTGNGGVGWGGDDLGRPGRITAPTEQRPLSADEAQLVDGSADGSGLLVDVGLISPSVSRVVAEVHGKTIEAPIVDGWFWFSTAVHQAPGNYSTPKIQLRAYDSSGALLDEVTLHAIGSITDPATGR